MQRLEYENVDQVLIYEFKMTLLKNDREDPCMCDPVDLTNEAKGHEMSFWSMIKKADV